MAHPTRLVGLAPVAKTTVTPVAMVTDGATGGAVRAANVRVEQGAGAPRVSALMLELRVNELTVYFVLFSYFFFFILLAGLLFDMFQYFF